jgi:putative inorganic carbon (HCO3(-)) transporter
VTSKPLSEPTVRDSHTVGKVSTHRRIRITFWKIQTTGLICITLSSFFPRLFHVQEYLFFLLLTFALVMAAVEKINPLVRSPIDGLVVALIVWILGTIPFSIDPMYSFNEWRKLVAHVLVFYWALFVLRMHRSDAVTRQLLWAVGAGSLVLAAYALTDFVLRGGTWKDRFIRAGAPYSDYNWLTTYMVLAIPVLIAIIVVYRDRWLRALAWTALPLTVAAQAASYTRAGWIAHIMQALTFGLVTGRRRLLLLIIGGAVSVGILLFVVSQIGYQKETINPLTLDQRVGTWKLGMQQIAAHPLVGVGFGNDTFTKLHPEYSIKLQQSKPVEQQVLPAMHNTFLMVAMGSGIPAALFLAGIFIKLVWSLVSLQRSSTDPESRGLLTGIAVVVVGFATRNTFDYMFAGSLATLFWILLAMGLSLQARESDIIVERRTG